MDTTKISSNILDRIKKCLNLADTSKGATEAEAIAAMSAAKRLMAEHNLNMSDIEMKEEMASGAAEVVDTLHRSSFEGWQTLVARACDSLFGTKHYQTTRGHNGKLIRRMAFIGVGQDASVASEAYTILVNIVWQMGYGHAYRGKELKSYCLGVAETLNQRAQDSVKDLTPKQQNKCTDIMVMKNQIVLTHMKSLGLRYVKNRSTSVNSIAYAHGKANGQKVNLSFRNTLK